ncbi:hypothetical protein QQY66_17565 [Streptomyces sp. DG2A-72]|uniref:hypothetical protein n=1 Tax=Streptomyces sp. DG2A-72 TaxID=3051386 RepID=UPI00265BA07D|nr:hypothetical protein [Streptomyces sp. DG2A-72]MDO0933406.1 hypothetical protein [Streptomyces sp. DG2A-72]
MNHHPDIHHYIHAARAADPRAQARAWELRRTVGSDRSDQSVMPARARLGWLLIEVGLRLVRPPTLPRPAKG